MADFNKVLEPGDYQSGVANTVIEIPQGSILKIEWDRKRAAFTLDRVEPHLFTKPVNYGFIPGTLDEDGDELDTVVVGPEPLPTGVWLEGRILGILNFEDGGEGDHKVVLVPSDDRDSDNKISSLNDLGDRWQEQIAHHFNHYKDLTKPGSTKVLGWGDVEEAKKVIAESIERFKNS